MKSYFSLSIFVWMLYSLQ